MTTYVIRNGKLIDRNFAPPLVEQHGTAPYVISDHMPATRHMADNNYYTSKAAFRQATKAAGCVEVGNEMKTVLTPRKPIPLDRRKRREDIKQAVHQIRNGQKKY